MNMNSQAKDNQRPRSNKATASPNRSPNLPSRLVTDDTRRSEDGQAYLFPHTRHSATSQETLVPTPPMNIPSLSESVFNSDSPDDDDGGSYMDRYLQSRKTSISFSDEIRTDSGHKQSIDDPLQRFTKSKARGRSDILLYANTNRAHRSNSESYRDHYDPITGKYLAKYSSSPPRDEAHVGEARFPLLQQTVDEMARESSQDISRSEALSLTTEATLSPVLDETHTPRDEVSSPIAMSSSGRSSAMACEGQRPMHRSASERWRSGEQAQDFFSRAGSLRKGARNSTSYTSIRRDTAGSMRSPSSAASSFLRGFSMGSSMYSTYPPAVDAEGQTIGEDYVIGKQIGFGGFSVIKEVTQMSTESGTQRKLAVKIVRRNIEGKSETENESAQAEFEHEVELWRFLNHPNILPLEAVYKLDEATFCFIPLNTGGTLFDLIRKNRDGLSYDLARNYAYQIVSALRYLHLDARVAHRDIKLENCLLDATGDGPGLIRLCDFGMAEWLSTDTLDNDTLHSPDPTSHTADRPPQKFMGPADSSTAAFAGGSLEYAAPEIVRRATRRSSTSTDQSSSPSLSSSNINTRERTHVSSAVDIWALGVCLYTMLVGKRPFANSFAPRVVMAILANDYDRDALRDKARDHRAESPIMELIDGCLSLDEHQRWRINEVMDAEWFREENAAGARARHEEEERERQRGWRL